MDAIGGEATGLDESNGGSFAMTVVYVDEMEVIMDDCDEPTTSCYITGNRK